MAQMIRKHVTLYLAGSIPKNLENITSRVGGDLKTSLLLCKHQMTAILELLSIESGEFSRFSSMSLGLTATCRSVPGSAQQLTQASSQSSRQEGKMESSFQFTPINRVVSVLG